jgi:hypothetical protein
MTDQLESVYSQARDIILSRFFALGNYFRNNYMSDLNHKKRFTLAGVTPPDQPSNLLDRVVTLKQLHCFDIQDSWPQKQDECYFRIKVDGVYHYAPRRNMGEGDVWDLNLRYKFHDNVEIELWDGDDLSAHDLLGSATIDRLSVYERIARFDIDCHYELSYGVDVVDPPEVGLLLNPEGTLEETLSYPPSPNVVKPWSVVHQHENPLIRTGKLLICLSVEAALGSTEALKIIRCALDSLDTLYKFKGQGNHFDGYIIRWDAVTSDYWLTHEENGLVIPDRCLNFMQDARGNYLYCTPFDDPRYVSPDNDAQANVRNNFCIRYRHWEPSQDEIVGLMMGYDIVYRLVGGLDADIKQRVVSQVNNLGDYLAEHGYMLVRPKGGFTARGAANILPALEYPFGVIFKRITGNAYRARCEWRGAVKKAGLWDQIRGPIYGASGLDLLAKLTLTERAVKITLESLLAPFGLSPVIEMLDFGEVARAVAIYCSKNLFDVDGTPSEVGALKGERASFAIAYILSKLPILDRFSLYMTGACMGMGGYAKTFPRYLAISTIPLPGFYSDAIGTVASAQVVQDQCKTWLSAQSYGAQLTNSSQLFEIASRVLFGKDAGWETRLTQELQKITQDTSWMDNESSEPILDNMCAIAMAWLHRKFEGSSISVSDFPVFPNVNNFCKPSVPNPVLVAAGSTAALDENAQLPEGPRLGTLPLHAIQSGRHGWDLSIDTTLGGALLFDETNPPLKPAEPVIDRLLPPTLYIHITYDFDGEHPLPNPELEGNCLDFGQLRLGYSPAFTLHFSNQGSGAVVVQSRVITGDFTPDDLSVPEGEITLDPSNPEAIFGCGFTPVHAGHYEGELKFSADAPGCSEYVIQLKADVGGLETAFSPTVDFGEVVLGVEAEQKFWIKNTGDHIIYFDVYPDLEAEQPFGQFTCGAMQSSLLPDEFVEGSVYYTPAQPGPAQAMLVFDVHPPVFLHLKQTYRIKLMGNGKQLIPAIQVNPPNIDFGNGVSNQEKTIDLQIQNIGDGDLTITDINVDPGAFYIDHYTINHPEQSWSYSPLPKTLVPGETLAITILFIPEMGTYQENLIIKSNDPAKPSVQVPLIGTCLGSSLYVGDPPDFHEVRLPISQIPGIQAHMICQGTNLVTITQLYLDPNLSEFTWDLGASLPLTLSPGQRHSFMIYFSPTSPGNYQSVLKIVSNAKNDPHLILKGQAS